MPTRIEDLTVFAQLPGKEMAARCGTIKAALSAGIIALSKLSPDAREKAIAIANGAEGVDLRIETLPSGAELDKLYEVVAKLAKKQGIKFDKPKS